MLGTQAQPQPQVSLLSGAEDIEAGTNISMSSQVSGSDLSRLSESSAFQTTEEDSNKERRKNLFKEIIKKSLANLKGETKKKTFAYFYKEMTREFNLTSNEELQDILDKMNDPIIQALDKLGQMIASYYSLIELCREKGKDQDSEQHEQSLKACLKEAKQIIESSNKSEEEQKAILQNFGLNIARNMDEKGSCFKRFVKKYKGWLAGLLGIAGGAGVLELISLLKTDKVLLKGGFHLIRHSAPALGVTTILIGTFSALLIGVVAYYLMKHWTDT